jgi:hypothetical protein
LVDRSIDRSIDLFIVSMRFCGAPIDRFVDRPAPNQPKTNTPRPTPHINNNNNNNQQQPQTDATVPEGHKGLHTYLYGEEGTAEGTHGAGSSSSAGGSSSGYVQFTRGTIHAVDEWLARHDSSPDQAKVAGVYGVYDDFGGLVRNKNTCGCMPMHACIMWSCVFFWGGSVHAQSVGFFITPDGCRSILI